MNPPSARSPSSVDTAVDLAVDTAQQRLGALVHRTHVEVLHLLASPVHHYDGRPRDGVRPMPGTADGSPGEAAEEGAAEDEEGRDRLEVRAGYGVVGDRYAGRAAHRDAALTLIAVEALEDVARELGAAPFDPLLTRRTVVLRGADVEALRGVDLALDCGDGPVLLGGRRPAAPCAWMDVVLAPGAHAALRGRAGVRCAALGSGVLSRGPAVLLTALPQDPALAGRRPNRPDRVTPPRP